MKLAPRAGLAHPIPLGLCANSAPDACPDPLGTSLYPACPEFRGEPRRARYPFPQFPLAARLARHSFTQSGVREGPLVYPDLRGATRLSRSARGHSLPSTFRINTCKSVTKQTTLTPYRINTYAKTGGGGPPPARPFAIPTRRPVTRKPLYFILLRTLGTLFGLFCTLPSFVFKRLQTLFAKHPGWGYPSFSFRTHSFRSHSVSSVSLWQIRLRRSYLPILATHHSPLATSAILSLFRRAKNADAR
jgi:hypothetical protein